MKVQTISKLILTGLLLISAQAALAGTTPTVQPGVNPLDRLQTVGKDAGYSDASDTTLMEILGTVISGLLGLLGAIFIILIVVAGYNWMTASGDEQKIDKAKDTIRAALIGLIIIVGAYAIWRFVSGYLITGDVGSSQYGGSGNDN